MFTRLISRLLIVCMIGLPFPGARWLDRYRRSRLRSASRGARAHGRQRPEPQRCGGQLQSLGLTPQAAKDRVAALTDAEVAKLAGQIQALPAGADGTALVLI
jgi:hypothetical protein